MINENCAKCQNSFHISKVTIFPCKHIVCLECFHSQEKTGQIICPICSEKIQSTQIDSITSSLPNISDLDLDVCTIQPQHHAPSYHCQSCGIIGEKSICPGCARKCHSKHVLSFSGESTNPCSCGHCCHCHIKNCGELQSSSSTCPNSKNTEPTNGPSFVCLDCSPDGSCSICPSCAFLCHSGHNLKENPVGEFVCKCGSGGFEECCKISHKSCLHCLYEKYGTSYQHGRSFICLDCFHDSHPMENFSYSICEACAKICHKGHKIIETTSVGSFYCDCGAGECVKTAPCKFWVQPDPDDHCTFSSQDQKVVGDYFICTSCTNKKTENDLTLCPGCAKICHFGHKLEQKHGEYKCSCGLGECSSYCHLTK